MTDDILAVQSKLWAIADDLRANSNLSQINYKTPVLGVIFLRHAEQRFAEAEAELSGGSSGRRAIGKADYQSRGVLFVPPEARYGFLKDLPEGADLGRAMNDAMRAIERENDELRGVLPLTYATLGNPIIVGLLRQVDELMTGISGDAYGKVYEYFLAKFAMGEGQRGGQFFTPTPLVRLIVEVIEPHGGRILDPAAGSGGMFVQSAGFVEGHREASNQVLSIYGQEKERDTVRLAKMNLAVNGLAGDIAEANSFYEDPHQMVGAFDFVMANPPFNVNGVDKTRLTNDARFPFGLPSSDNANYLWVQMFYAALNDAGRAGFVMPNSAGDARGSELEIRRRLLETGSVDVILAVSTNFFLTVTLPCTLWFFDRAKERDVMRADQVLFIDAKQIFTQIDRAHRTFSEEQLEFLANIVRLHRGELPLDSATHRDESDETASLTIEHFPEGAYRDIPGLCARVTMNEIEEKGWSLNPGRYVGTTIAGDDGVDFQVHLEELAEEFASLTSDASALSDEVQANLAVLLGPAND
ncbi:type I restriction-modification system subunit M [Naasia lichenicola]|uniref:site-specific DNA-methyltransferase (adenine-specific) n=1 Tax=Naasia lichenicola TaxID=2565933 RepID=A0A4S4FS95_9MICO|nr:class I SAM-dependent DNA methyltransferase [Naasia lichenicola]THG33264.1 SAM-dependent DNA methyltransferase [Naasia lichenicola]